MHKTIASQLQEALPTMKLLDTFVLAEDARGGIWSELLDALSAVPRPFKLVLDCYWDPDDDQDPLVLAPRTCELNLTGFTFPFPIVFDESGRNVSRRPPDAWDSEVKNVRSIFAASSSTLSSVYLPGELFHAMQGLIWDALTDLCLEGLWPIFDKPSSPAQLADNKPITSSTESSESVSAPAPPISKADEESTAPSNPSTSATSTSESESPLTTGPVGGAATSNETAIAAVESLPPPHCSPILSVLEAMPNLRFLDLRMVHHGDDPQPVGALICSADGSSTPAAPDTFLRHVKRFQATSLSMDDRIVDFLPPTLEVLSLPMFPYMLQGNTLRAVQSPSGLLAQLKKSSFPELISLTLWYSIASLEDLEDEEPLLDFLSTAFPSVEILELSRRWEARVPALQGRWDALPVAKKLASNFKCLKSLMFDLDLPERYGRPPVILANREFREMVVRLHSMAEEIANVAPWLQRIGLYREFGHDPHLFWETWNVVPAADGKVGLDRPPPPVNDSVFY
ncbi:F-box domain-containing protein [Mycena indigotica]|uniref:F-box domain-containing protein n=1 Tax=Mycena indigotica TaxID=2126181 RepID=A0A8H6W745_9AGAR|nr:F-box domain-containing protein [Mycena indigotica]KAF7307307.1 F-box domain-containing protein [Mycena indigotica]